MGLKDGAVEAYATPLSDASSDLLDIDSDAPGERSGSDHQPPLFVDLDYTLIKTDLLIESCVALVKQRLLYLFLLPLWLLRGKAHLKHQVATRVTLDASLLPYHEEFLAYLRDEAVAGRRLVLTTASHHRFAQAVASHLGIFAQVIASDEHRNLIGKAKLKAILKVTQHDPFFYAGDSTTDLPLFRTAAGSILVDGGTGVARAASRASIVFERVFDGSRPSLRTYARALRLHQWAKNLLLFAPLVAAHRWDMAALTAATLGFLAFSLCASGVYLLNDIVDLPSDRAHPRKRHRALASGELPILRGAALAVLLPAAGLAIAFANSLAFLGVLMVYLAFTTTYSMSLKRLALVDALTLAALYTLRVIAGAVAIREMPSFWILAFSMFIFLSLALVKRCSELKSLHIAGSAAPGRGYTGGDYDVLQSLGTASGYVAVLVIALFFNSSEVTVRYSHPEALWMLCPIVLFWTSWLWIKTNRGEMHDDPLVFSFRDRGSRLSALFALAAIVFAL